MSGIILASAPSRADVRQRVIDIAAAAPNGVIASLSLRGECAIEADNLPALVGVAVYGAPTREMTNTNRRLVTVSYGLLVLFAGICSASDEDQQAALDVAWALLDELPDWFAKHPRLQLNDSGLPGVYGTGHMADQNAPQVRKWSGSDYAAALYSLPVTTNRG